MKRTYTDVTAQYYDGLDQCIDWGEEIDMRVYDIESLVKSKIFLNEL